MRGASRTELENSLQVLGELNQALAEIRRYSAETQQLEITNELRHILNYFFLASSEYMAHVNQQIISHGERLDTLIELEDLFSRRRGLKSK